MNVENDDSHSRRAEEAVGGRKPGGNCPHDVALFTAASSDYLPAALWQHLGSCPVCKRTYELAKPVCRQQPTTEEVVLAGQKSPSWPFADNLGMQVPTIRNFKNGRIRCIGSRRHVLLLLLDPRDIASSWGRTCLIKSGNRRVRFRPGVVSVESLFSWQPGESITLLIDGSDELTLDWNGWGDQFRSIAVAFHQGSVEESLALLREFEDMDPDWTPDILIRDSHGNVSDRSLEQLMHYATPRLRRILESWKGVDSKCLDLALDETCKIVLLERNSIPTNSMMWLLEKSVSNLRSILKDQVGASGLQEAEEAEEPEIEEGRFLQPYRENPSLLHACN